MLLKTSSKKKTRWWLVALAYRNHGVLNACSEEQTTKLLTSSLTLQIYTEHAASFLGDPPRGQNPINMHGAHNGPIESTRGSTLFSYSNSCHREVIVTSEKMLLELVRRIKWDQSRILESVSSQRMIAYVTERLDASDSEWLEATQPGKNAHRWLRHVKRFRRKQRLK